MKDIISVAGQPCTCASKILRNYRATYDATVVQQTEGSGRDSVWKNKHGRVCDGIVDGEFEREADSKSLGRFARARRLQRRIGRGGGGGCGFRARSARTRAGRCGSRRRCPASWD